MAYKFEKVKSVEERLDDLEEIGVGNKLDVQQGHINALAGRAYNLEGRASALETGKVNKDDIINNLGTNDASKVLSAAQGVELSTRISTVGNNLHTTQQNLATLTQRVDNLPSGGGGSTSLTPYFLNNANVCEEVTEALNDFIANGTPIVYNHEGDNCTLVAYEDSLSACYFVVPNGKKLLKVDLSSGAEFVVTEMDFCNLDGNHGGGSSGGGASGGGIIDVDTLPYEDINENVIYRLKGGLYFVYVNRHIPQGTAYIVDELPETGEPCTLDGNSINAIYYEQKTSDCYGYVPSSIAPALGVSAGWYAVSMLLGALGYNWGGIVGNIDSILESDTFYFLKNPSYNAFKDGLRTELSRSGKITLTALLVNGNLKLPSGALAKMITDFENTVLRTVNDDGTVTILNPIKTADTAYIYSCFGLGFVLQATVMLADGTIQVDVGQ